MIRAWTLLTIAIFILVLIFLLFNPLSSHDVNGFPRPISTEEAKYINAVLQEKNCGDCELTETFYGWKCVDQQGKTFRVY